ncbi:MAG TPA: hypothetical protein VNA29_05425 [Sphingomicrobium sp.]|nr:hypothetical protein [Sphingomicrobium sp.]
MRLLLAATLAVFLMSLSSAVSATPLFASDVPLRVALQGPVNAIARKAAGSTEPHPATLTLTVPAGEVHPIRLSARGLSRRKGDICRFPPLRVEFSTAPAAASLFAGQRRLKLVTHCQSSAGFQQHLLREYAAYKLYNLISPLSFRARLATVDYVDADGRPIVTRFGFFIEDKDDAFRRNGLRPALTGDRIVATQLNPRHSARMALFQYMIGNLDWSMRAGPEGEGCCHNARLAQVGGSYAPMPYDFDFSGLVDAPYAVPPDGLPVRSVRNRLYRGYCRHNGEALAVAAEVRTLRPRLEAVFGQVPGIDERSRQKAIAYLAGFFADIASDATVRSKLLRYCIP